MLSKPCLSRTNLGEIENTVAKCKCCGRYQKITVLSVLAIGLSSTMTSTLQDGGGKEETVQRIGFISRENGLYCVYQETITHTHTHTQIYTNLLMHAKTMEEKGSKSAGRTQKIAKCSQWEEREEIRLIEQKVVKCMQRGVINLLDAPSSLSLNCLLFIGCRQGCTRVLRMFSLVQREVRGQVI